MNHADLSRKPLTVPEFRARKGSGPPLVVLTAYDVATAAAAEAGGVDCLLVGDSLGNVVLGYDSTLPVTMHDMLRHARAVGRTRTRALLVADMPWLSYHLGAREAVRNAARFVREAGVDAVKLEGGSGRLAVIRAILDAEIPVMGHIGLTPQSVLRMGGYRVQGKRQEDAERLAEDARALAEAGVFSIVLEGVPGALAERITAEVDVPTIGIGAGPACDGQVLVFHDLLGLLPGSVPKFVRRYADLHGVQAEAIRRWAEDVRSGSFPSELETYAAAVKSATGAGGGGR
jgi:3-methyl-2-oxobutanoate hydroxymethyltransferase